jgi:membrane fusion protein, heavy metal efflux system
MNQNIKLVGGIVVASLIGIILYFLYFRDHDHASHDGHDHEIKIDTQETDAHTDEHEKMVHLNEAQFKNAGIELGWFDAKNLSEVIHANGYTKLPPQNQALVSVLLPGNIQTIKVMEGQYVKAGQVLATMQSLAFNNLRLEREKLSEQLMAAQTQRDFLQLEYARQKVLTEENVNAKKVFEKISADLKTEELKISALSAQIGILSQNIEIGGNASSPIINITAPISGNITDIHVNIGSSAEVGKPLFSIVDNTQMHVDLLVYEKDLFKVKPKQTVRFTLTNQGNQEIMGKIFSVGKSFENETKSVAVHADILNEKQILIPGMYVNALIDIGMNKVDALPLDAIVKAEGREFIFLWEKENLTAVPEPNHEPETSFARIEVKTGPSQLGFVQVTPLVKIHDGDKIVVKGAYYLQSHLQKSEGGGGHAH